MESKIQTSLEKIEHTQWDVIVVGAGPAGSIAALHLARAGKRVLLLDKKAFPREKICGDGLVADSLACLKRAGLYEDIAQLGHESRSASIFSPGRIRLEVSDKFICLKRKRLDYEVARAASEAGAVFCCADVEKLTSGSNKTKVSVQIKGNDVLECRVCLVATGADVRLLKQRDMLLRGKPSAVAARCYVRSSYPLDQLIISFDRCLIPGYAWIFPMGKNEYNIGCGIFIRKSTPKNYNLRQMYDTFCREFPIATQLIEHSEQLTPLRFAMLRCGLNGSRLYDGNRILALGEAVGSTFPFTGEGIGKAMETGEIASKMVNNFLNSEDSTILEQYPSEVESQLRDKYFGYQVAENWLSKAWLSDFVARRAQRSAFLHTALSGIISEKVDPRMVFSVKGILKSLWQ
jgi:geranylgeranyl reductase family protein